MTAPLNLDALQALCDAARKERYDWWNQGAPDSADMRVASGEAEQTRDSLCNATSALIQEVRRLTKECESRGDLISDYQVGQYAGDEYKIERTHEALMLYQVEPL